MAKPQVSVMILAAKEGDAKDIEALIAADLTGCVFVHPKEFDEAMEQLKRHPPNLVIAEAFDGGENVIRLLSAFPREQRSWSLMIVTRDRSDEIFKQVFELGADDFLLMPLDNLVLQSKVRSLLSQHYMSPLSFLGKREGIGDLRIFSPLQVLSLNEDEAVALTSFPIVRGTSLTIQLTNLDFRATVQNTERADQGLFKIVATVDTMSEDQGKAFRKFLMGLATTR